MIPAGMGRWMDLSHSADSHSHLSPLQSNFPKSFSRLYLLTVCVVFGGRCLSLSRMFKKKMWAGAKSMGTELKKGGKGVDGGAWRKRVGF